MEAGKAANFYTASTLLQLDPPNFSLLYIPSAIPSFQYGNRSCSQRMADFDMLFSTQSQQSSCGFESVLGTTL
jgi:hypothetical protein